MGSNDTDRKKMHIFTLIQPGGWLQWDADERERRDVQALLNLLVQCVTDAAISLDQFQTSRAEAQKHRYGPKPPGVPQDAEPVSYHHRLPFLHAKSCVYALDTIDKSLVLLCKLKATPMAVHEALAEFRNAFPGLNGVRNSAHHVEDRVQGKAWKKHVDGIFATDILQDSRYGGSLEDGSYGELDVTFASVDHARRTVQAVLDAYKWIGYPMHFPI
jgi:hypothetical protein